METKAVNTAETGENKVTEVQKLRSVDLPDPIPDSFTREAFADILRNMKGDKSAREFAASSGLSDSFISKAINCCIENSPSKRTLLKLLQAKTDAPVDRRELAKVAGYPEDQIDWARLESEEDESHQISAAEAIARIYGGNHYVACGRLMKALSEHGVTGDISCYVHREDGYFEIKDEVTGQVYVGINVYCNTDHEMENTVHSMIFSLALTFQKVAQSSGANRKIVIIMTNNEELFDDCQNFNFDKAPKATLVVLSDEHKGFKREEVLGGRSPISLLD